MSQQRIKDIAQTALRTVEKNGTITNSVLFSRIEREHSDLGGRVYSDALNQLRELNLVRSFDGGHDRIHEITPQGVCMLANES
jgi:hypothetical protein